MIQSAGTDQLYDKFRAGYYQALVDILETKYDSED